MEIIDPSLLKINQNRRSSDDKNSEDEKADENLNVNKDSDNKLTLYTASGENAVLVIGEVRRRFKCDHCAFSSNHQQQFNIHLATHEEKPFKCHLCYYSALKNSQLKLHMKVHPNEEEFKCDEFQTSTASKKRKNFNDQNSENPYKCQFCNFSASEEFYLTRHSKVHLRARTFKCDFCNDAFIKRNYLVTHMKIHVGPNFSYKELSDIVDSGKIPASKSEMPLDTELNFSYSHIKLLDQSAPLISTETSNKTLSVNSSEKLFKCGTCHDTFTKKNYLFNHMKTHDQSSSNSSASSSIKDNFTCGICNFTSHDKTEIFCHMKSHSPSEENAVDAVKCHLCDYSVSKSGLELHIRRAHNPSNKCFLCDFCDCTFANRTTLRKHRIVRHRNKVDFPLESNFKCDVCGFLSKTNAGIVAHKTSYNYPHVKCEKCDYVGENFSVLSHMKDHAVESDFKCEICSCFFKNNSNLQKHCRIHFQDSDSE